MKKILLIEDEISVSSFIEKGLKEEGYLVFPAYEGTSGLTILINNDIDLIILDLILPDMDGFKVCEKIRALDFNEIPILMLTALSTSENIVKGLDSGADDYLVKPFRFQELLARLRSLSRRKSNTFHVRILSICDLSLNLDTKIVVRGDNEISLTSTEYRLLEYMMKNQKKVLSRVDLLENVWDINFDIGTNVVDVYMNYLRKKIDRDYGKKLIHTIVGMGYIMREQA